VLIRHSSGSKKAAPTSLSPIFRELPDSNPVTRCHDRQKAMENTKLGEIQEAELMSVRVVGKGRSTVLP